MSTPGAAQGLSLDDIAIALGGKTLLRLSRRVEGGGILTVMGPSGSGKSTLLRHIAGALPAGFSASGSVMLDGERLDGLPPERRRVGLLFQDDLLFPHLSVGGNLMFGLPRAARERRRAIAEQALAEAGLAGLFDRDPATLSGGQKARVALLRVLLSRPRALLLDEPFSKLDVALRRQMRAYVFGEAARHGLPMLLVTHDPDDAEAAGGDVVRLET